MSLLTSLSTATDWASACRVLDKVLNAPRRDLFARLCAISGVHGASGLEYMAKQMVYVAGGGSVAIPRSRLSTAEVKWIDARVLELLEPFIEAGDPRLHSALRGVERRAA